ncbi:hypothetical protein K503DRAFT_794303 [Rhizopogon vinicolor AM-OR11-026]|uniref:Uncharacterized protein n=1 Tax=Rhizopogon vinicolor AM-OR11-026 TaxID=1314800 RepID=A0A1B7MN85_9AGAM|nr:hypothetical protein K503DRAFT_794303 [Rhizopogon vinicolor AM-OR11-026]
MNRWLLVEFIDISTVDASSKAGSLNMRSLDGKQIYDALRDSVMTNFGDAGWGVVGMSLIVTLLTDIDDVRVIPYVVHVSGTVKHAQLSAIAHNREVTAWFRTKANIPALYQDLYDDYLARSTRDMEALQV